MPAGFQASSGFVGAGLQVKQAKTLCRSGPRILVHVSMLCGDEQLAIDEVMCIVGVDVHKAEPRGRQLRGFLGREESYQDQR